MRDRLLPMGAADMPFALPYVRRTAAEVGVMARKIPIKVTTRVTTRVQRQVRVQHRTRLVSRMAGADRYAAACGEPFRR